MLHELRELHLAQEAYTNAIDEGDLEVADLYRKNLARVVDEVHTAFGEPTNRQALALARLIRQRPDAHVAIRQRPFDLPEGYWLVSFTSYPQDEFQCGIAPNGDVSS
jgi:hypothetical protein